MKPALEGRFWMLALALIVGGYLWLGAAPDTLPSSSASSRSSGVPAPAPGQKKVALKNLGMGCPFCKAAVSAKLKQVSGVIAYEVDLKTDSATVLYDPTKVSIEGLKKAIAEAGYQVRAVEEIER